jgi:hypothetical protein
VFIKTTQNDCREAKAFIQYITTIRKNNEQVYRFGREKVNNSRELCAY